MGSAAKLKERLGGMSNIGDCTAVAQALTAITRHYLPSHHWGVQTTATGWEVRLVGRDPQNETPGSLSVAQSQALHVAFSGAGLRTSRKPNVSSEIGLLIQFEEMAGLGFDRRFGASVTEIGDNAQVTQDLQRLEQIRPEVERTLFTQTKPPQLEIDQNSRVVFDTTTGSPVQTIETTTRRYVIARNADDKNAPILMVKDIVSEGKTMKFSGEVLCYPSIKDRTPWKTGPIQAINFASGFTWHLRTGGWCRTGEPAALRRETPAERPQSRRAETMATASSALPQLAYAP